MKENDKNINNKLLESLIEEEEEENNKLSNTKIKNQPKEILSFKEEKDILNDYVLILDNPIEYKEELLKIAKKKVWKVVKLIKENKELKNIIINDENKFCFIIKTNNKIFKIFKSFIYCLLFLDYVLTPYEYFVSYNNNTIIIYRCLFFDIIFFIEILIKFISSYYDYKNQFYVTNLRLIFWKNIKITTFINIISIIPFYLINIKYEIIRLLKLYRYPIINSKFKSLGIFLLPSLISLNLKQQIMRVIIIYIALCYILHFFACIYTLIGMNYERSWLKLNEKNINSQSNFDYYINSFYFMTETFSTTGYGDLCPKNNEEEFLFLIFCEIVNCAIYAYLLTSILEIITKGNSINYQIKIQQLDLVKWIRFYINRLPASSKKKNNLHRNTIWNDIKIFFDIYYSNERNLKWIKENKNLITYMKPNDKNELFNIVFKRIYIKFDKFFCNIIKNWTKQEIVLNFDIAIEMYDTKIIPFEGDIKRIYFIVQGEIEILNEDNQVINILKDGDYFGIEKLSNSYNGKSNYIYKVGKNYKFCIFYSIKISYLIDNILNYDGECFKILMNLAIFYCNEVLHEKSNDDSQIIISSHNNLNFAGNIPNLIQKINRYELYLQKTLLLKEKIKQIKNKIKEINSD